MSLLNLQHVHIDSNTEINCYQKVKIFQFAKLSCREMKVLSMIEGLALVLISFEIHAFVGESCWRAILGAYYLQFKS